MSLKNWTGNKIGAFLCHIEIWHTGKCIGIKDCQVGSGITSPCKNWFVPEKRNQLIRTANYLNGQYALSA